MSFDEADRRSVRQARGERIAELIVVIALATAVAAFTGWVL